MISLIFALTLTTPTIDDWTPANTAMEAVLVSQVALDVMQTRWFVGRKVDPTCKVYCAEFVEANPILGLYPSQAKLYTYASLALVGHAAVAVVLPRPYREIWQMVWIGIEGAVLASNAHMVGGVRLAF